MLKYVLTICFILTLWALLQHPVPVLENITVYAETPVTNTQKATVPSTKAPIDLPKAENSLFPARKKPLQAFPAKQAALLGR